MKTPKTWQECCDEVAKKNGYESWYELTSKLGFIGSRKLNLYEQEAAILWRDDGIREAVRLAREYERKGMFMKWQCTEQEIIEQLNPKK